MTSSSSFLGGRRGGRAGYDISRRTLLRGSLGLATAGALAGMSWTQASAAETEGTHPDADIYGVPTASPLIKQRADPFITVPVGGMYYFTASVPEYDRLVVRGSSTIAGLGNATETVIWRRPTSGKMGGHIWAPELHRIDGRWYMYFAAGDAGDVFRIRTYVLESALADPRDPSGWTLKGQIATEWDGFTLDSTTFAHGGRRYLVWAQSEPEMEGTSIYIAEMSSPWALKTKPTRITSPTLSWEVPGFKVNEGPAVLVRNGRVFITYSAAATDARYCMGLVTADADANLLDRAAWRKSPTPVFTTNEQTKQYGPGHNSFTVAEDGVTDVLVYHARDYRDITGDSLYDPNRHTRVQKLYWHPDGTPMFGIPVGVGGPIVRLSPALDTRSFVRQVNAGLQVERAPYDLASTQFRFVAGLQGEGTESIQSVANPDRYVQIDGNTVKLGVAPAAGSTALASFQRVTASHGIKIRAAADGPYLQQDESGRLTVGTDGTTFRLS